MIDGTVTVLNSELLDRETNPEMTIQILAKDPSKSTSVPLNITILDENDNAPRFIKKVYTATIVDNIPYYPDPSPIIQLLGMISHKKVTKQFLVTSIKSKISSKNLIFFIKKFQQPLILVYIWNKIANFETKLQ